jgi:hypothetical protein
VTHFDQALRELDHELLFGNGFATREEKLANDDKWDKRFAEAWVKDAVLDSIAKNGKAILAEALKKLKT